MANFPWDTVLVGLIVGTAAVWAVRGMVRAGKRKQVCTTCGSAGSCPLAQAKGDPAAPCGVVPVGGPAGADDSPSDPGMP